MPQKPPRLILKDWVLLSPKSGETTDRVVLLLLGEHGDVGLDMSAGQAAGLAQMLGELLHTNGPMQ